MKLLLHICCGPCSIHPYRELKFENFDEVSGFFYNPNIHPFTEYRQRKQALEDYSKRVGLNVIFHKYDMENFFKNILDGDTAPGVRCEKCWRMRLEETANFAKSNNFGAFSTTLLVSPYQSQERIKRIGEEISEKIGPAFVYKDFRSGFHASQLEAKRIPLYRQKYCGCVFSEKERYA